MMALFGWIVVMVAGIYVAWFALVTAAWLFDWSSAITPHEARTATDRWKWWATFGLRGNRWAQ